MPGLKAASYLRGFLAVLTVSLVSCGGLVASVEDGQMHGSPPSNCIGLWP